MKIVLTCAVVTLAQQANAGLVIDIVDDGGNVELTYSGEINTDALTDFFGNFSTFNGYSASGGNLAVAGNVDTWHTNGINWTPFGTGGFGNWDSSSGDAFAMWGDPALGLPTGYISGTALSGAATRNGESLASLGFADGTYVTVLTNGSNTDTVTVNIGIPTPGTLAMLGLGGLAATRRRR